MDFKNERSVKYQISSFYMYLQPQIGTEYTPTIKSFGMQRSCLTIPENCRVIIYVTETLPFIFQI